jgi:nucleotide-binding universal stress UspA family protein
MDGLGNARPSPENARSAMLYKTILVHCNDTRRIERLLVPAVDLAERFQAHLIGLSIVPPVVVIPAGMPGAPDTIVVDTHCRAYRQESPKLKAAFEAAAKGRNFVAEWCELDAASTSVADVALQRARAADLIIASQSDPEWPPSAHLDVADRLAVEAGRPVLIIPGSGMQGTLGRKVLVAWNGRREAARAAFDAIPILQQAKEVKVVWVNPQYESEVAQDIPAADICTALARHGVKCEATHTVPSHQGVGHTLLALAKDYGCDLLVMGCYGHSRLREFVLGGASRHVLNHMGIPVLMSH